MAVIVNICVFMIQDTRITIHNMPYEHKAILGFPSHGWFYSIPREPNPNFFGKPDMACCKRLCSGTYNCATLYDKKVLQ